MNRGQRVCSSKDDADSQMEEPGGNEGRNQYHKRRRKGQRPSSNESQACNSVGRGPRHGHRGRRHQNRDKRPDTEHQHYNSRGRSSRSRGQRPYGCCQGNNRGGQSSFGRGHSSDADSSQNFRCEQQQSDENNELDIPGFVYDKEKKRYFKIAPNHSQNPYTKDAIARRDAETKRQRDLDQLQSKQQTALIWKKRDRCGNNFGLMIQERPVRESSQSEMETVYLRTMVSSLRPAGSQHLFDVQHLGQYENLEHLQMMKMWKDHDCFFSLWTLKKTWIQRLQIVNVSETIRTRDRSGLAVNAAPSSRHNVIIQSLNKVTDMCWAPMSNNNMMHILYTTICHTGTLHSLAVLRCPDIERESSGILQEFNLGRKATWTCAWNQHRQQFSVGSERCALLVNVERRTMYDYKTNNSDPLAQVFSHQTGNSFYTGTRKGEILVFDCRGQSIPVTTLRHKSSVCSLNLLQNDHHLIAADFTGKLHLWDLRQRKVVMEYPGNVNQYTKLPVHVDEREELLYTVGEDGYTRFWCLKQGTPLYTLPPPCQVSRETIPRVQLSTRWGNSPGNAGLIMGLENKLYLYGKLPDS